MLDQRHLQHFDAKKFDASMSKGLTLKEAIKVWEEKNNTKAEEATIIKCMMSQPFITKMDATLQNCSKLEQLSLSTNLIEKISNLNGLGISV
jgi:dynein light chain 1